MFALLLLCSFSAEMRPRGRRAVHGQCYLQADMVGVSSDVSGFAPELTVDDNQKVAKSDPLFKACVPQLNPWTGPAR
jgi:hypothetical protein